MEKVPEFFEAKPSKSKTLTFRVSEELYNELINLNPKMSISAIAKKALVHVVKKHKEQKILQMVENARERASST